MGDVTAEKDLTLRDLDPAITPPLSMNLRDSDPLLRARPCSFGEDGLTRPTFQRSSILCGPWA